MPRTITVKGVGKASASPDYVTLSIVLESFNENYDSAMDLAEAHIQELTAALVGAGFEKEALKTTNFNVRTEYNNEKDQNGNWKKVFSGYVVTHDLKLEFDFNMERLSQAITLFQAVLHTHSSPSLSL